MLRPHEAKGEILLRNCKKSRFSQQSSYKNCAMKKAPLKDCAALCS